jgi:peptidoglycan/xylan/chitin deacetylase (PgdA/CDA1 family)
MDRIRHSITPLARRCNLKRLIRLSGQNLVFPFYHTVAEQQLPHLAFVYRVRTPKNFEQDLDQLLQLFEPMSLSDYLADRSTPSRKRSMLLSFDDGLAGCHSLIAPLLRKRGIPAVFFLNNRFIDNKGLFYRYKTSLLIDRVREDCKAMERVSEYLKIDAEQVEKSLLMIAYDQRALLDKLAIKAELDFSLYLNHTPVYLSTEQVEDLVAWGFDIGGHSSEHMDFAFLSATEMVDQIKESMDDLQKRFGVVSRYFSFPFTSDGVPRQVIDHVLDAQIAEVLMGTAGLKRTGRREFIQRIPMEDSLFPASDVLKVEYLYYLLKMPLGKNRLRQ